MTTEKTPKRVSYNQIKREALEKMSPEEIKKIEVRQQKTKESIQQNEKFHKEKGKLKDKKTVSWVVDNMVNDLKRQTKKNENKKTTTENQKEVSVWTEKDEEKRQSLIKEIEQINKEITQITAQIETLRNKDTETPVKDPTSEPTKIENKTSEEPNTLKTSEENIEQEAIQNENIEQKREYSFESFFEEIKKEISKQEGVVEIGDFEIEYPDNQIKISGYLKIKLFVNREEAVHRMDIRDLILEKTENGLNIIKKQISTGYADSLRRQEKVQTVLNILENLDKKITEYAKTNKTEKIKINGEDFKIL